MKPTAASRHILPADVTQLFLLRQLPEVALGQFASLHMLQNIGQHDEVIIFGHQLLQQEQVIVAVDGFADPGEIGDGLGQFAMQPVEKPIHRVELFPELGAQVKRMILWFRGLVEPPRDLRFRIPVGGRNIDQLLHRRRHSSVSRICSGAP